MGWNTWKPPFECNINETLVKKTTDLLRQLLDERRRDTTYVNLDDCWMPIEPGRRGRSCVPDRRVPPSGAEGRSATNNPRARLEVRHYEDARLTTCQHIHAVSPAQQDATARLWGVD